MGDSKVQALNYVVEKMKKRTQGWKKDSLFDVSRDRGTQSAMS
ncbi:hypothetical protein QN277_000623 [Acacia crassicarpa]|uniref:Uncharacterized protein n=1 Tax=Acacia crassicarpa TaxID=499986 RepID=A0AAE1TFZ1_9FABA|nr:hypothetical protein QN277_000623 [Acacia crassicarpa]